MSTLSQTWRVAVSSSVPQHLAALANPLHMNLHALRTGLPRMVGRNVLQECPQLLRDAAGRSRLRIDASLRRCMESAMHTYTDSVVPARLVILSALQTCGKNMPYMIGVLAADAFHRGVSRCDAAPLVSRPQPDFAPAWDPNASWSAWLASRMQQLATALSTLGHLVRIVVIFLPLLATSPLVFHFNFMRQEWMVLLRATMEVAGPAFIKWGQWAATRQDMFPPDMCKELARLHCDAPSHPWAFTKDVVERAFGVPTHVILDSLDEVPLASGSIGQVHRATLSQRGADMCGAAPGTEVVLKVKHPNVSVSIRRDFDIMVMVAAALEVLPAMRRIRLRESLQQFATPLKEQVDLTLEASNLWRFNQNFSSDGVVSLPTPLYPWVSPDVLMETFEPGMHISTYMEADGDHERRAAVAGAGSHCMLSMLLRHHFVHGDLHPGNILVRWELPQGWLISLATSLMERVSAVTAENVFSSWLRPHVVLLDVGMVTELTERDRDHMFHLFQAFTALDGAGMAQHTLQFAGREQTCTDPQGFIDAITKKMESFRIESWQGSSYTSSAAAFSSVLDIVREYQVTLPGHICAVLVTMLVLEGWSSKLAPERSVLEEVKGVIAAGSTSWMARLAGSVDACTRWAIGTAAVDAL